MKLSDFTIKARLLALAALAVAAMLVVGLQGLRSLSQSKAEFVHYVDNDVESLTQLAGIRAGVGNLRRYEKDLLINLADAKAVERYRKEWNETFDKVSTSLDKIGKLDIPDDVKRMPAELQKALQDYRGGFSGILERVAKGEFTDTASANQAMEPVKGPVRALDKALAEMTEKVDQHSVRQVALLDEHEKDIRLNLTLVVIGAVLLLVAYTAFNIRSILAPLAYAVKTAERIAGQDLSQPVRVDGRDETAAVMRGVQGMQDSLSKVVSGVRRSTDSIAHASREVAVGSQDLSNRTEQAASNLQETASAMEELTASVTHNAESARQANQLAGDAAEVARRGGAVVDEVVQTMGRISASSHKISDIISVIDGIAFQTNILALNAAVEAARAGEQGRGFAVVASEVRTLAQRSAEAAKEIKTLITRSGENVDGGTALVAQAGGTMKEIIEAIARVSAIVSEISLATGEQSTGIGQIGQAIAGLDQMTQQNAALVEESAAAAVSLQQQADELSRSVAVFRLN
ncbi:MAG: MCP four helix bundle domain-containing protein [Burkholderiales bacterium]|nr:MCP four helix bundle domain-containing protein [Burkholderiales bacterium]